MLIVSAALALVLQTLREKFKSPRRMKNCEITYLSPNPAQLFGNSSTPPLLIDTSCILFCQLSNPSSESEVQELILILQLQVPSAVGLM